MTVFLTYFWNGNHTLVHGQFSILISLLVSFQFSILVSLLVPFQFSMLVSLLVPFQCSMLVSLPVPFPFVVLSLALNRKFVKQSTTTRIMFKPSSGRKVESGVWEHFVYEAADDKSRCCAHTVAGKDVENQECGTLIVGTEQVLIWNVVFSLK